MLFHHVPEPSALEQWVRIAQLLVIVLGLTVGYLVLRMRGWRHPRRHWPL